MNLVPNHLEAFLNFDKIAALNDEITATVDAILVGETNESERARAMFEWVSVFTSKDGCSPF